jgi:threonine/homoserine/homoserine lactone efflux protein
MRHSLSGGRRNGSIAAITHGLGIGLYALLCISGLAVLITASPMVFTSFQWAGAAYLAWLGIKGLRATAATDGPPQASATGTTAARDGFLVVFLNPKVAVFFIALFSQVIGPSTPWLVRGIYAGTAWLLDTAWYLLVAFMVTQPKWLGALQKHSVWIDRTFGLILLALAAKLLAETLA